MSRLLFLMTFIWLKLAAGADLQDLFKSTYAECDESFEQIFSSVQSTFPGAQSFMFQYPVGTIKTYFLPAQAEQKSLFVLISGTHGIEGFAGSAVQRNFLQNLKPGKNTAYMFIHGFNLWGFKNLRRVNEKNVDLNRAFIIDRNHFKPDDSGYTKLNEFLNPVSNPDPSFFGSGVFLIKSLINLAQSSMETLRVAILKGQYSFPSGIFYGGNEPQPQELMIDQLIQKYILPFKKVFIVDLHTGYGARGKLHLLAGKKSEMNSQKLSELFGKDEIDFSDKEKFYPIEGELNAYFSNKIAQSTKAETLAVTFEFGTMDSQTTTGSIESLRRMVLENQNFHSETSEEKSAKIKSLFLDMFFPSDQSWRNAILVQAEPRLKQIQAFLN